MADEELTDLDRFLENNPINLPGSPDEPVDEFDQLMQSLEPGSRDIDSPTVNEEQFLERYPLDDPGEGSNADSEPLLTQKDFQQRLGSYLDSEEFQTEAFPEKIERLRNLYLGEDQGGLNWEEGTKDLYLKSVQALRLMDDVQITPEDYQVLLPEFKPIEEAILSDKFSRSQKIELLDAYEATALSVARDQGKVFWDEIKDVAEPQIAREIDEYKKDIQGGATFAKLREKFGQPGRALSALYTTESRFAKGIINTLVADALPDVIGDPLSRAVETSVLLPEDPEFKGVVAPIPGTDIEIPAEDLARGVGQGFGFIGGGAAIAAKAGLKVSAAAMLGVNARLTYKDAYQKVFERTGNAELATDTAVNVMPVALIDTLFDAAVVGRAYLPIKKALGIAAKRKVVSEGIQRGAFGDALKTGFKNAGEILISGATEGAAEVIQDTLIGEAVASATSDPSLKAKPGDLVTSGLVGSIVGAGAQASGIAAGRDIQRNILKNAGRGQQFQSLEKSTEKLTEDSPRASVIPEQATEVVEGSPTTDAPAQVEVVVEKEPLPSEASFIEQSELTTSEGKKIPIERRRIPLDELTVQKDIPQFKRGADPKTGVVGDPRALGEFEEVQAGNIVVLEKDVTANGELEVLTGRNRFEGAKRSPKQTDIAAIVIKESDGFSIEDAKTLDAESNIRDNQGEIDDFARFFERANIDLETARSRGLVRNVRSARGFAIGKFGSTELRSAFFAEKINETTSAAIANAAPNDSALQRIGIQQALKGRSAEFATNIMQVSKAAEGIGGKEIQQSLFGENDQALRDAEVLAQSATDLQREARQTVQTLRRAQQLGKTPNVEQLPGIAQGINISDPAALQAEINRLSDRLTDFQNWAVHPNLVQEVQQRAQQNLAESGQQLGIDFSPAQPSSVKEPESSGAKQGTLLSQTEAGAVQPSGQPRTLPAGRLPFDFEQLITEEVAEDSETTISEPSPERTESRTTELRPETRPLKTPKNLLDVAREEQDQPTGEPRREPKPASTEGQPRIENLSIPAAVKLTKQITQFVPGLFKSDAVFRGMYLRKTGRTFINQKLPRDLDQLARTLAHEVGHAIDLLSRQPNQTGLGSNLLGRLVPLAKFGRKVFGETEVLEKLLPTKQLTIQGEEYQVVVSYGTIRAFQKKEVQSVAKKANPGDTVERFVPISLKNDPSVPVDELLDAYAETLVKNEEGRELFNRVRNWTRKEGPRPITENYSKDTKIGAVMADPVLRSEAWELSRKWRPITDKANEKFLTYRLQPQELYADFVSALINSPQWVESSFPNLFNAFKSSLQGKPDVLAAMEELSGFLKNPESLIRLLQVDSAQAANKSIDIARQAIIDKTQTRKKLLEKIKESAHPKRALNAARQMYMENYAPVLDSLEQENRLLEDRKKKALEQLARLRALDPEAKSTRAAKINRIVRDMRSENIENSEIIEAVKHIPQRQWMYVNDIQFRVESQLDRIGITPDDFHNLMVAGRILNETSPTREWILKNPDEAKKALEWIAKNARKAGYVNFDKAQFLEIATSDLEGEALSTEMAKVDLELETTDGSGKKRRALAELADKIGDENLFGIIVDGFNVRRYMANPNGWTPKEAKQIIDSIEKKYGEEKFAEVQEIRQVFADANWEVIKQVNEAGLVSRDFFERLELNKDNYASFNVVKYFAENPKFSARFHKQVGTFEDIGNTLLSTVGKKTMLLGRAMRQHSINNTIEVARKVYEDLGIDGVREVRDSRGARIRYPKLLFETLDKKRNLQGHLRNPEASKSYLVEYKNGQPVLWEIDDPSWQRMTERMRVTDLGPVLGTLLTVQQIQKAFYTVLSPAFVLGTDPIRNKSREAQLASTWIPKLSFLWWHLSPSLAKKSKTAKQISKNLTDWATGITPELAQDTPLREEVLQLVRAGRIMLPISGQLNLARTVVGTPDIDLRSISEGESLSEMAQLIGVPERFGNNLLADSVDLASDILGDTPVLGDLGHASVEILARQAHLEELRTKLTGYLIERERTETLRDAGQRAELWYGAPRPRGGGSRNPEAESVALFWRVSAYTPRVMKQIITEEPVSGANVVARSLIQKSWMLPATGAVMYSALAKLMGLDDEQEKRMQESLRWAYRMIGRYEKSAQNPIPFGFYHAKDDKFVWLWNADPKDLANGWEAVYMRRPADPDERIVNRFVYSLLEGAIGGQSKKSVTEQLATDLGAELTDVAPAIRSTMQLGEFVQGENPSDDFYSRGVLPREIAKGGTKLEKTLKFGEFLLARHLPYFNYKLSTDEKKGMEKALARFPGSSKLLGISRYGLIEEENVSKAIKEFERDSARLNYPQEVKSNYREYFQLQKIGKEKRTQEQENRYIELGHWKFSVFDYYDNEIRHANRLGEDEFSSKLEEQMLRDTNRNAGFWRSHRYRRKKQKKGLN